jgi:hypothetical protein
MTQSTRWPLRPLEIRVFLSPIGYLQVCLKRCDETYCVAFAKKPHSHDCLHQFVLLHAFAKGYDSTASLGQTKVGAACMRIIEVEEAIANRAFELGHGERHRKSIAINYIHSVTFEVDCCFTICPTLQPQLCDFEVR